MAENEQAATRAVIYARVGDDEQDYSFKGQFEACRKYAADRGYEIVGELNDTYSGEQLDRPSLNALRATITRHGAGVILVTDLNRLASEPAQQQHLTEELAQLGAKIEQVPIE